MSDTQPPSGAPPEPNSPSQEPSQPTSASSQPQTPPARLTPQPSLFNAPPQSSQAPPQYGGSPYGSAGYPPPQRQGPRIFTWIVIGGGVFFLFVMSIFSLVYLSVKNEHKTTSFSSGFGNKIAVVPLEGVILESKPFMEQVQKYDKDDSIKA